MTEIAPATLKKDPVPYVRIALYATAIIVVCAGLYQYAERKAHEFDEPLNKTLARVSEIHSYAQYVDTSTIVSDRPMRVYGWYLVDHDRHSYAAYSTTTLHIPPGTQGSGDHSFTHDNVAIDNMVYVKIDTNSELLKSTINDSDQWKKFEKGKIPEPYRNIAVPGPILDNLRIFSNEAKHLELVKKYGLEEIGDTRLRHYRFKMKSVVPEESTVGALAEHLGSEGTIDIWTDDTTNTIVKMIFAHNTYTSTTTLSDFNTLPQITPPEMNLK